MVKLIGYKDAFVNMGQVQVTTKRITRQQASWWGEAKQNVTWIKKIFWQKLEMSNIINV